MSGDKDRATAEDEAGAEARAELVGEAAEEEAVGAVCVLRGSPLESDSVAPAVSLMSMMLTANSATD